MNGPAATVAQRREATRGRPLDALLGAAVCIAGLVATGAVALAVPVARAHDSATLGGFTALAHTRVTPFANHIAHLVDPGRYALIAFCLALIALLRRRPRLALAVGLAMVCASATSELLKPLVAQPRFSEWLGSSSHINAASWPSGHATAAMAVALGAVMVAPRGLRPLVALLGAGLAVGVSYSILVLGWHFPSDVLGGFLVAGAWMSLTLAALRAADARWPARSGRRAIARAGSALAPAVLLTLALGAAAGVIAVRGRIYESYAAGHLSFVLGAGLIAALAALLPTALAVALREAPPRARRPAR